MQFIIDGKIDKEWQVEYPDGTNHNNTNEDRVWKAIRNYAKQKGLGMHYIITLEVKDE